MTNTLIRPLALLALAAAFLLSPDSALAQTETMSQPSAAASSDVVTGAFPMRDLQFISYDTRYVSGSGNHYLIHDRGEQKLKVVETESGREIWSVRGESNYTYFTNGILMLADEERGDLVPSWSSTPDAVENGILQLLPSGELRIVSGGEVVWTTND